MTIINISDKAKHVLAAQQTRQHHCHWPGCKTEVPPAMWGCRKHWYMLPKTIRNKIWGTYRPGQESDLLPSQEYILAAREAQEWIDTKAEDLDL